MEEKKRWVFIDILNIISCFAVVFVHCNFRSYNFDNTIEWRLSLMVEFLLLYAVPVFIMISGATLLNYRERYDTIHFFKKRISRVVIPFIIWSIIYYILKNKNLNIINFTKSFLNGNIEGVFWFFPTIIYLYCLIPIFSLIIKEKEHRKVMWAIVIWIFVFQSTLIPICKIMGISFPALFIDAKAQHPYIMFLLLGYLISTSNNIEKRKRILIYILGILAFIFRYVFTVLMSVHNNELVDIFFSKYEYFPNVFQAVAVFVFIKQIDWDRILSDKTKRFVKKLSSLSFGIYLTHMLAISLLKRIFGLELTDLAYRTIFPIIVYAVCAIGSYIIKKIPVLKKIVP